MTPSIPLSLSLPLLLLSVLTTACFATLATGASWRPLLVKGAKAAGTSRVRMVLVAVLFLLVTSPVQADYLGTHTVRLFLDPADIGEIIDGYDLGDEIGFILEATPRDTGSEHGHGAWMTFYVPPGAIVIGASVVVPGAGTGVYTSVPPTPMDDSYNNCGKRNCKDYTFMDSGTVQARNGYVNRVQQDTGIFYSTDSRTAIIPLGSVQTVDPTGTPVTNAFNQWDLDQVVAFGESPSLVDNDGKGNTPVISIDSGVTWNGTGSPVAGPETYYTNDYNPACDGIGTNTIAADLQCVGPWNRIAYAGSQIGDDDTVAPTTSDDESDIQNTAVSTGLGFSLSAATPLPAATNALRYTHGARRIGDNEYGRVKLRITDVAAFTASYLTNPDVFCIDTTPGDTSDLAAKDNNWRYYEPEHRCIVASASGVLLKQAMFVDGAASNGTTLEDEDIVGYEITFTNTSGNNLTNVMLSDTVVAGTALTDLVEPGTPNCAYSSYDGVPSPAYNAGTASGGTATWATVPTLAPGESLTVFMCGHVDGNAFELAENEASVTFTTPMGMETLTSRAGGTLTSCIKGTVYADNDSSGDLTAGDIGVPFVTVSLYFDDNHDGVPDAGELIDQASTAGDGSYGFAGMEGGAQCGAGDNEVCDYLVVETDPTGVTSTGDEDTTGSPPDCTANACNIIAVTLSAGGCEELKDFFDAGSSRDWGDLPNTPYSTLNASGGPSHGITASPNVFMGATVDSETDGQPSAGATDDGADEDGVLFLHPLVPGYSADVQVTASGAGFLSAFIDLNSDGDFSDTGEKLAGDVAVVAGANTLNIASIPAGATGVMAARFRITALAGQGGDSITGPAPTGEVEDYMLGCIGDFVWNDLNGDGIQDGGSEVGVPGVTVNLVGPLAPFFLPILDANGVPITTTTDVNGNYEFCGLPTVESSGLANPGEYRILFDLPGAFTDFSPPNTTGDANDSDADQDQFGTGLEGLAPLPALAPITINSGLTDATVDAGLRAVTAALITSAGAYNDGGSVVFEFSTGYEVLSASFEVHRFDSTIGDYVPVTERPISALLGSPQGGVYRVVDEDAPFSQKLSYVVVEHQTDGKTRAYGPFPVRLEARSERTRLDESSSARAHVSERLEGRMAVARRDASERREGRMSVARREAALSVGGPTSSSGSSFADPGLTVNTAQVNVRDTGLYYVSSVDLAAALGLPEANVRTAVQKANVVVENQGRAIAWFEPNGSGDGLYFYGEALDSLYTLENTYWLRVHTPGVPMESVGDAIATPAPGGIFQSMERFEKDLLPSINATLETEVDFWYWDGINAASADTIRTFDVAVPDAVAGKATITARFAGATNGAPPNDHHAIVRVNGVEVGTAIWGGMERFEAEMVLDSSLLTPLTTLEVEGTLAGGSVQSIFFIDGFDIDYPRTYHAGGDRLALTGDGNAVVTVESLSSADVVVFDVSDPALPRTVSNVLVEAGANGFQASFVPSTAATPYLVTTLTAALVGTDLRPYSPAIELIAAHHSFDHVVIAPEAWRTQAEDFAAYRSSQGLASLAVSIEEVYNAFSWGNPTPWAIRDFLAYARDNWVQGPDYAVLAGRGTFDHRDLFGDGDSFIPIVLVGTPYGLISTDNVLADLKGSDSIPEVAIGRLPIVSGSELATYLARLEAYDASSGDWRGRAVLLADNPDAAGDFPAQSDAVAAILGSYDQELIYLSEMDIDTARVALQTAWNNGAQLVNYIGHGGVTQAAAEGLLRASDMDLLNNSDRLPIVSALTCVLGRSDIPNLESLAEALVTDPDGGAIAVWAPTGVSLSGGAHELNLLYAAELGSAPPATPLGRIVLRVLKKYGVGGGLTEMLDTYSVVGDPAVQLP